MAVETVAIAAPGAVRVWLTAVRPRTLPLAAAPVLVGVAFAAADAGRIEAPLALATLLCALLIQAGTNLHNDAADHAGGNDGADRLGPLRVTAAGWATAAAVRRAALLAFAAAFGLGVLLAARGGWPIVAIGVAALLAAAGYSGGPRPLSHGALGELCVWLFFGLIAVAGSYWLQCGRVDAAALLAGALLGAPAAAVLLVNNLRDLDADGRAGRRTLAARLGPAAARRLYAALMLFPFALLPALLPFHRGAGLALLALPLAWAPVRRVRRGETGRDLNAVLAASARSTFVYALLLALGSAGPWLIA